MLEMWSFAFMQRALLAGLLVGILCALVGFFVVLQRMSFVGVGVSHSAFGGIALGLWLGLPLNYAAMFFAIILAWAIGYTSRHGEIHEDTTIGIFFSAAMALGVLIVSVFTESYVDLFSFLFGNILAVGIGDLRLLAVVSAVIILLFLVFFQELLFSSFDGEVAAAQGIPTTWLYYGFLTVLAVTVVVSVKVVGVVLASAMLVLPAATGYQLSKNYRGMIGCSLLTGPLSTVGGLMLSYQYDLPSGATIVLVATAIFILALIISPRRGFRSNLSLKSLPAKLKAKPAGGGKAIQRQ